MRNSKTFFVTGATGNQGGAVARSLINRGFRVKALTRNSYSLAARNLHKMDVEIVQGTGGSPRIRPGGATCRARGRAFGLDVGHRAPAG